MESILNDHELMNEMARMLFDKLQTARQELAELRKRSDEVSTFANIRLPTRNFNPPNLEA